MIEYRECDCGGTFTTLTDDTGSTGRCDRCPARMTRLNEGALDLGIVSQAEHRNKVELLAEDRTPIQRPMLPITADEAMASLRSTAGNDRWLLRRLDVIDTEVSRLRTDIDTLVRLLANADTGVIALKWWDHAHVREIIARHRAVCVVDVGHGTDTPAVWRDSVNTTLTVCDHHRAQYDTSDIGPFNWEPIR